MIDPGLDDFDISPALDWTPLREADLDELAELREAIEYVDDPIDHSDREELQEMFEAPGADPEHHGALGRDQNGSLLAYAWGQPRVGEDQYRYWFDFGVHPAQRYRNIGRLAAQWLYQRALDWWANCDPVRDLWVGGYVDAKLGFKRADFLAAGLAEERWFSDMWLRFGQDEPEQLEITDPEGIALVPFEQCHREPVRLAHNRAYGGNRSVTGSHWNHYLSGARMRPDWSWVALADDQVVGYILNSEHINSAGADSYAEGWTDYLGVIEPYRGRGVAKALLAHALDSFRQAGLEGAGLGVDADEPIGTLFAHLGFHNTEELVLMSARHSVDEHTAPCPAAQAPAAQAPGDQSPAAQDPDQDPATT